MSRAAEAKEFDLEARRSVAPSGPTASHEPAEAGASRINTALGATALGAAGDPSSQPARILRSPRLAHPTSSSVRAQVIQRAQKQQGNRFVQRALRTVQRQCACGGTCPRCRALAAAGLPPTPSAVPGAPRVVQTQAQNPTVPTPPDRPTDELLPRASQGEPLDPQTQVAMSAAFGRDLGAVRVHHDAPAQAAAAALHAHAFTSGRDIYFAAGQYAPQTSPGKRLLAHELAHTVQQEQGRAPEDGIAMSRGEILVGRPDDPLEREADRAAETISSQGSASSLSADASGAVRRVPQWMRDAGSWAGDTAAAGWDATGGRVVRGAAAAGQYLGEKAEGAYESVRDWAIAQLEEYAPGLLEFLRSDLIEVLKDKITQGLDSLFGGLISAVQEKGLLGALSEALGGVVAKLSAGAGDACSAIAGMAQGLFDFAREMGGTAWNTLKQVASAVGGFLSDLWQKSGLADAWEKIKNLAGSAWTWIKEQAEWLWKKTEKVRQLAAKAWDWVKGQFNLAWDSGMGILDWLKEKALAAWDKVKGYLEPVMGPLKVAAGVFLLLSGIGPILLIWKGAPILWDGIQWLANNWGPDLLVRAREVLQQQLPTLMAGIATVRGYLGAAAAWIAEQAAALTGAMGKLVEALGLAPALKAAQRAVAFLSEKVSEFVEWAGGQLNALLSTASSVLQQVWEFLRPILVITFKLTMVIANPFLAPIFFGAWAWKIIPDCLKPPVVDFLLDLIITALEALPDLKSLGEVWAQIKTDLLAQLVPLRSASTERKVEVSNRIANFIAGGDIDPYVNLISAVRQVPDHFVGQAEEELIGMDLGKPLPFERTAEPDPAAAGDQAILSQLEAGTLAEEDAAVLRQAHHTDDSVGVTHVASMDPEFLSHLDLPDGASHEFGESNDPDRSMAALQQDLATGGGVAATPAPKDNQGIQSRTSLSEPTADAETASPAAAEPGDTSAGPAPAEAGTAPALGEPAPDAAPLSVDEQLDQMIASQPDPPCTKEKSAEGPAQTADVPAHLKIGPLTQGQRGRYMWAQIKKGIASWYNCNKTAIWVSVIAALVVLIVAAILTGGAILEAIPPLMEIIGAIMIGVAIVRVAAYVAAFVTQAFMGDTAGAAKSLARGLAIGAIELVFALLFNLGAVIKSLKGGLSAAMKGLGKAAKGAVTGVVKSGRKLAQVGLKAGKNLATNLRRVGTAVVKNGKIVMQGLERGFTRGAKSLKDLAKRLWNKLRFRKFKIQRSGAMVQLWGYINPWVLLASGRIIEVHVEGRPMIGDLVEVAGHKQAGIIIGVFDTLPSTAVKELQALSVAERRALFRRLIGKTEDEIRRELLGARQTAAHAKELRDSMTGAGLKAKPGDHAHHLVPSTHRMGDEARKILAKFKININAAENGLFVSEALHSGLHTNAYIAEVTRRLRGAQSAADVMRELDEIKRLIKAGNFP